VEGMHGKAEGEGRTKEEGKGVKGKGKNLTTQNLVATPLDCRCTSWTYE